MQTEVSKFRRQIYCWYFSQNPFAGPKFLSVSIPRIWSEHSIPESFSVCFQWCVLFGTDSGISISSTSTVTVITNCRQMNIEFIYFIVCYFYLIFCALIFSCFVCLYGTMKNWNIDESPWGNLSGQAYNDKICYKTRDYKSAKNLASR